MDEIERLHRNMEELEKRIGMLRFMVREISYLLKV